MSRRSSSSSLEILFGLLGGALVALGAFIWRVYTAKPDEILQPNKGDNQP